MKLWHYILDSNKNAIPLEIWTDGKINHKNLEKWSKNFENIKNRRVGYTKKENFIISTVFLGIDHNYFNDGGKPILFETAVTQGENVEIMERYRTWDQAEAGHKKYCYLILGEKYA